MPGTIAPTGRSSATAPLASHVENFARREHSRIAADALCSSEANARGELEVRVRTCTRAAASSAWSFSETQTQWASSVR